ncbi:MAG: hypothetical protein ACQER9_04195, partial [Nanobdellota archaeon]
MIVNNFNSKKNLLNINFKLLSVEKMDKEYIPKLLRLSLFILVLTLITTGFSENTQGKTYYEEIYNPEVDSSESGNNNVINDGDISSYYEINGGGSKSHIYVTYKFDNPVNFNGLSYFRHMSTGGSSSDLEEHKEQVFVYKGSDKDKIFERDESYSSDSGALQVDGKKKIDYEFKEVTKIEIKLEVDSSGGSSDRETRIHLYEVDFPCLEDHKICYEENNCLDNVCNVEKRTSFMCNIENQSVTSSLKSTDKINVPEIIHKKIKKTVEGYDEKDGLKILEKSDLLFLTKYFDPDKNKTICKASNCNFDWEKFPEDLGDNPAVDRIDYVNSCCGDDPYDPGTFNKKNGIGYVCMQNPDGSFEWVISNKKDNNISQFGKNNEFNGNIYSIFNITNYENKKDYTNHEFDFLINGSKFYKCGNKGFYGGNSYSTKDLYQIDQNEVAYNLIDIQGDNKYLSVYEGEKINLKRSSIKNQYQCYSYDNKNVFAECASRPFNYNSKSTKNWLWSTYTAGPKNNLYQLSDFEGAS